jgi:hypothetical protein
LWISDKALFATPGVGAYSVQVVTRIGSSREGLTARLKGVGDNNRPRYFSIYPHCQADTMCVFAFLGDVCHGCKYSTARNHGIHRFSPENADTPLSEGIKSQEGVSLFSLQRIRTEAKKSER